MCVKDSGYSVQIVFFVTQEHMIQSEVSILRRVKHPNIVLLIEEMDTQNELYLVMELVKVRIFYFYFLNEEIETFDVTR